MKRLELKELKYETGETLEYRDMLLRLFKNPDPPAQGREVGIDFETMEKWLEIRRLVKCSGDAVLFEDEQWKTVVARVNSTRWIIADEAITQFVRDVRSAPSVDVMEKQNG